MNKTIQTAMQAAQTPTSKLALFASISHVLQQARAQVRQTVNTTMVQTYWQVGRLIVEDEQHGNKRADYGKRVLPELAVRLTAEFGDGFKLANLRNFRQFYLTFTEEQIRYTACSELSWSHLRMLIRIENVAARGWYANETVTQGWSVRALDRQISTLFYDRLLGSLDTLPASKQLRNWVAQGVLVALPSASRKQASYSKPDAQQTSTHLEGASLSLLLDNEF